MPHLYKTVVLLLTATYSLMVSANEGTLNFRANVTTGSCSVVGSAGASGVGSNIGVKFPPGAISDLNDGRTWSTHGKRFQLAVTCPSSMGHMLATARFAPGAGLEPRDNQLLALSPGSTARGVALALWEADRQLIDLSSTPELSGAFTSHGSLRVARIELGAMFARLPGPTRGGSANANLPFTLDYE